MFEKIKKLFRRDDCSFADDRDPLMRVCLMEAMKGNVVHASRDEKGNVTMTSTPVEILGKNK